MSFYTESLRKMSSTSHYIPITDSDSDAPRRDCGGNDGSFSNVSYESAIVLTGYGWFQYRLLAFCGWALSADAIEVIAVSFVLPYATCDFSLAESDKGYLTAIIFLGMMIGGYVWGSLADVYGRRKILLFSLAINGLAGLASSFSQGFYQFLIFRFVSGMGVGGNLPVIFAYYTEFQPKARRGAMISLLAMFWMAGSVLAAAAAWLIIPAEPMFASSGTFQFNNWQVFIAICTLPALTAIPILMLMSESPRFLMLNNQEIKALRVLNEIYVSNGLKGKLKISSLACERKQANNQNIVKRVLYSTIELYRKPWLRTSALMTIILATFSFAYYGMIMWMPEMLNRVEIFGGSICSLQSNQSNLPSNNTCAKVSDKIYWQSLIMTVIGVPCNLLLFLVIDRIGRKMVLCISLVGGSITVFLMTTAVNKAQSVGMSYLFYMITGLGWIALDVLAVELYPTQLRSTASGIQIGVGRVAAILGNIMFGILTEVHCMVPLFIIGTFLSVGGIATVFLPSTLHIDLM